MSTPTLRMTALASSRIAWYWRSESVICGATVIESPVWTPMASKFSIEQTMITLSAVSRMTSSSNSFQPSTDSSIRTSWVGDSARPFCTIRRKSAAVRATPPPDPPIVNDGRTTSGRLISFAIASASASERARAERRHLRADLEHRLLEEVAVLGQAHGVLVGADQLHVALLEHAPLGQRERQVDGGLPADGRQDRVRPLAVDDPLEEVGRQRLDVRRVGQLRVGHDRRGVRVDEDDPVALAAQRADGLGARSSRTRTPGR